MQQDQHHMTKNFLEEVLYIDIDKIVVNPYQPRTAFSAFELDELAESIKAVGILHPPLVRSMPESEQYELISGERRWRASKLAGLQKIPVVVCTTTEKISAQAALIENVQRVDLNPMEIAKGLRKLVEDFDFNQETLAARIGKKRSTVANYLRLLSLPETIQESVSKGCVTMGHAKAILGVEGAEKQIALHEVVLRDNLTVRETEQKAIKWSQREVAATRRSDKRDIYLDELVHRLRMHMGTRVDIKNNGNRGTIEIDYYSLDDLDRILSIFGVQDG